MRDKVARLLRDWAACRHAGPGMVPAGRVDPGEYVRLLGGILFSAVLPGEIGERLRSVLPKGDERLLLALNFSPQLPLPFVEMPWEHLYVSRPGSSGTCTWPGREDGVRPHAGAGATGPRAARRRELSVLMVGVTPPGQAEDSPAQRILENAARLIDGLDGVRLDWSWMQPPGAVRSQVQKGAYDIVHYVGFGQYLGVPTSWPSPAPPTTSSRTPRCSQPSSPAGVPVVVLQQIEGPKEVVPPTSRCSPGACWATGWTRSSPTSSPFALAQRGVNGELYQQLAAGSPSRWRCRRRIELWMKSRTCMRSSPRRVRPPPR